MSFVEQKADLAVRLRQLEELLRQAQSIGRSLEESGEALTGQTETLADDTALAQVSAAARKARQELSALMRSIASARAQLE